MSIIDDLNKLGDESYGDLQAKGQEQLQKELESQANQQKPANNSGNGNSSQSSQAGGSATNLPATGPEDSLVMAIGATLLVGVGVSYARSRQLI